MMQLTRRRWLLLLALVAACGAERPIEVSAIQVGRARNADRSISSLTYEFKPNETVLAAVMTQGDASNATVRARWTFGGAVVGDSEQRVPDDDPAITPFELRSAGGFPAGEYKLEIFLNGAPAGERVFRVR